MKNGGEKGNRYGDGGVMVAGKKAAAEMVVNGENRERQNELENGELNRVIQGGERANVKLIEGFGRGPCNFQLGVFWGEF